MLPFKIGDKIFESRLFLGTGKFGSNRQMEEAILASGSELVTVALKRIDLETETDAIISHLKHPHINLLPNTSGARNAKEAIFAAQLAREALSQISQSSFGIVIIDLNLPDLPGVSLLGIDDLRAIQGETADQRRREVPFVEAIAFEEASKWSRSCIEDFQSRH